MASGSHYMLEGIDVLSLYGKEPSAIEQAYAIFANVLVCCNRDMFTKGLLSPALSSSGGEGEEAQAGHIYCVKL
jgi:hypothetical protein